jgi:hypothetical protein
MFIDLPVLEATEIHHQQLLLLAVPRHPHQLALLRPRQRFGGGHQIALRNRVDHLHLPVWERGCERGGQDVHAFAARWEAGHGCVVYQIGVEVGVDFGVVVVLLHFSDDPRHKGYVLFWGWHFGGELVVRFGA